MAKLGYDSMLLPGEELMYKIQGVYDVSQHLSTVGSLYITSFQSFFVDEARGQLKDIIPHGCVSSLKKYKNQSTNNVPITDKLQYLEVRCKDLRIIKYVLPTSSRPAEVRRYLEHAALPDNMHDIFAFSYSPQLATLDEGWNVYNPLEDYRRIGLVGEEGGAWRVSEFNTNFATCPTYPELFVVPSTISDKMLEKVVEFRSKARIPVCVWKHSTTFATISRCSQPLVGLGRRSEEDEALVREIRHAGANKNAPGKGKTLYIVDARPKVNAAACTLSGGGTEIVGNYSDANASLEYCGIANIHIVRESFKRLGKVCRGWDPRKSKWSDVTNTHWLDHISSILTAACRIVTYVDVDGCSVLTHCTDGWDRTSQLCALAEMLMDPYYRTIKGLVVLICKEFISFGHKFNTRNGNISHQPRSQCAPIFVQFMDCVWQLTRQFPTSFEFSENLLLLITTHLYTHLFGTFLCDNECERSSFSTRMQTSSLWGLILHPPPSLSAHIMNAMYTPHPGTLHGNGNMNSMQLWRAYYQRWNMEEGKKEEGKKEEDRKEEDRKEEAKKEGKEENGKANGLKGSGGGVQVVDVTLLHEMVLIPFLDNLTHSERTELRRDLAAWLSTGGGRAREKVRVMVSPRVIKGNNAEQKGDKFGTVRSSSSKGMAKASGTMSEDEGDWEGEEGGEHNERSIRRGRSFSTVFAKMTGRGTLRGDKGQKKEDKEDESSHNSTNSTNSSASHNATNATNSHNAANSHNATNSHNPTTTTTSSPSSLSSPSPSSTTTTTTATTTSPSNSHNHTNSTNSQTSPRTYNTQTSPRIYNQASPTTRSNNTQGTTSSPPPPPPPPRSQSSTSVQNAHSPPVRIIGALPRKPKPEDLEDHPETSNHIMITQIR